MNQKDSFTEGILFAPEDIERREGESNLSTHLHKRGRKRSTLTEERPAITQERMREILEDIHELTTPLGIKYIDLRLTKKMIIGVRESSGKEFTINLDDLYQAYEKCLRFTSPEVKRYIFMGHSPAVALLRLVKERA